MRKLRKSSYVCKNTLSKSGKRLGRPPGTKNPRQIVKRKPGTVPPKMPPRPPGHPPDGQAAIPPRISKQVAAMWLAGYSATAIADKFGTHLSAMDRHIKRHLIQNSAAPLAMRP